MTSTRSSGPYPRLCPVLCTLTVLLYGVGLVAGFCLRTLMYGSSVILLTSLLNGNNSVRIQDIGYLLQILMQLHQPALIPLDQFLDLLINSVLLGIGIEGGISQPLLLQ